MAIRLSDNILVSAPKPTDERYGPYANTAAALAALAVGISRHQGQVVGILNGGSIDEYWFRDGVDDPDLILKTTGGGGYTGSAGDNGPIGFTGSAGDVGLVGFTGSEGAAGLTGFTGSASDVIGFTGSEGAAGITGFTGSEGAQGVFGFTGSEGAAGTAGDVGFTGSEGLGLTGFTGSASDVIGFTGSEGLGLTGFTGSQGVQGDPGNPGGFTGSVGDTGFTGSRGYLANWILVDSASTPIYTASTTERIIANTIAGNLTVNLPTSPLLGDYVDFTDGGNWTNNSVKVVAPGETIEGWLVNVLLDVDDTSVTFVYDGNTWQFISSLGPQGDQGDLGYTGSAGEVGPIGFTGSEGAQGTLGFTGSASDVIGFTGSAGDVGVIGFTGSAGSGGASVTTDASPPLLPNDGDLWWDTNDGSLKIYYDDGDSNAWVDASPSGAVGFTGSEGAQGTAGTTGFTGSASDVIGFTGSEGAQGTAGTTGFTGSASDVIGFTGSEGAVGFTGSEGAQGTAGSTGFTGSASDVIGFTGSEGSQGIIGFTGSVGAGSNLSVDANVGLDLSAEVLTTTYNTLISDGVNSVVVGGAVSAPASVWRTKNIVEVLDTILFPDIGPTYTVPAIALSGNITNGTTLEIGRTLAQALTATALKNDAGEYSNLSILRGSTVLVYDDLVSTIVGNIAPQYGYADPNNPILQYSVGYTDSITVPSGSTTWSANSSYGVGLVKLNNKGAPDANAFAVRSQFGPQSAANSFTTSMTPTSSITVTGIYPYFWGKSSNANITISDIASVIQSGGANKVLSSASGTVTINYNFTNEIVWFAHHTSFTEKTVWYFTALNNGVIGPGNFILSPVTQSVTSPDGYWTQNFKIYRSNLLSTNTTNSLEYRNS